MGDEVQPAEVKRGVSRHEIAAWILMAAGLLMVSKLHLLSALLAGLLVYELVHVAVLRLRRRLSSERAGMVAVTALVFLILGAVAAAVMGLIALVRSEGHLASLLEKLADSVSLARANLPSALSEGLPANADALKDATVDWLRLHAKELRTVGADFGRNGSCRAEPATRGEGCPAPTPVISFVRKSHCPTRRAWALRSC